MNKQFSAENLYSAHKDNVNSKDARKKEYTKQSLLYRSTHPNEPKKIHEAFELKESSLKQEAEKNKGSLILEAKIEDTKRNAEKIDEIKKDIEKSETEHGHYFRTEEEVENFKKSFFKKWRMDVNDKNVISQDTARLAEKYKIINQLTDEMYVSNLFFPNSALGTEMTEAELKTEIAKRAKEKLEKLSE